MTHTPDTPAYPYPPTANNTWLMESAKAVHNTLPRAASDEIPLTDVLHHLAESLSLPLDYPDTDIELEQVLKIQAQIINGIFTKTVIHAQELERDSAPPALAQDALACALAVQSQFCRTALTMNELKTTRVHFMNAKHREAELLQDTMDNPMVKKLKDLLRQSESKLISMKEALAQQGTERQGTE